MRDAAWDDWVARARAVPIEDEAASRGIKLSGRGADRSGPCPVCGGRNRFAINVKKQVYNCRGCKHAGDVISFVEFAEGVNFTRACEILTGEPPPKAKKANGKASSSKPTKRKVAAFSYRDRDGNVRLVVERFEFRNQDGSYVLDQHGKREKSFLQKRPDPQRPGKWIWNAEGVPPLIYRLPEVLEVIAAGQPVLIVEGEGKANLLASWGIAATCIPGGAGGVAKNWSVAHSEFLRGAACVLLPDNDDRGWHYVNVIGAALQGVAGSVHVLLLPNLPQRGDVADWIKQGGTAERLQALLAEAQPWQPPPVDEGKPDAGKAAAEAGEDELLEALRKMRPGIERSRARKRLARQLGVPGSAIDDEIKARLQEEEEVEPLHAHWIVELWPEAVDGDSLLRAIIKYIQRHVVCSDDAALTVALWVMFSWVHDAIAVYSPILLITSAEKECGKSTLMGIISFLMPRCISSVEVSEAALFRSIERWHPSLCIDEFDDVLKDAERAGLRSVINSGHTRGTGVIRCVEPKYVPTLFPTFSAKCIGMLGRKMPDTTLSRCLIVELQRRLSDEAIEKFEHEDNAELANLRSRLLRWSTDNVETLRAAKPAMPANFDNRRGDNWSLLFAIADLCAEDWGAKAREAAIEIEKTSDTVSLSVRLLIDIKRIFDERLKKRQEECENNKQPFNQEAEEKAQSLFTEDLLRALNADEEGPWAAWGYGKGLSANTLSTFLAGGGGRGRNRGGFNIHSENIRGLDAFGNNLRAKGYKRKRFTDAWKRYLPAAESAAEEAVDD